MVTDIEAIGAQIVDAAVKLHIRVGPGLMEDVYLAVLAKQLELRGLTVERKKYFPVVIDGIRVRKGLCPDLIVNGLVVVELKSAAKVAPEHLKQVLTYLRILNLRLGFLINFGAATAKQGLHRVINSYTPFVA